MILKRNQLNPPYTVRERLCDMLCREGFGVYYEDLIPVTGFWKSQDVYRWRGSGYDGDRNKVHFESWDTMTECARYGITVHQTEIYRIYEVFSKLSDTEPQEPFQGTRRWVSGYRNSD